MNILFEFTDFIIELLYPNKCIFCDDVTEAGTDKYICGKCLEFSEINTETNGNIIYLYKYSGYVRNMIRRFKYNNRTEYAIKLGELLAEKVRLVQITDVDLIIPVPMHRVKKNQRGYNQAELLADELGKNIGVEVNKRTLIRKAATKAQSLVGGKKERYKNVCNAFSLVFPSDVEGKNVILVDDIYTTGSTAKACIKELEKGGIKKLYILTVAYTQKN